MLKITWYLDEPIDFEYKNYLLLAYLVKLDESFSVHKLSPYLFWTEKLVEEMRRFEKDYITFGNSLKKEIVGFSWKYGIIYEEQKTIKQIDEIIELINYSVPILEAKIQLGYKLNTKYPQFLY